MDFITAPWIPTEKMREVREMRRIVEIMDNGSKKAFAEKKKAHLGIPASTSSSADAEPGVSDLKAGRGKDMMDIMRQSGIKFVFTFNRNVCSEGELCVV